MDLARRNLYPIVVIFVVILATAGYLLFPRLQELRNRWIEKKAFSLAEEGKYGEAVELFRKLPSKSASFNDATAKVQAEIAAALGSDYLSQRKYSEAIHLLEYARSLSGDVDVEGELAVAYALNGDLPGALEVINSGIQKHSDEARLYVIRASIYKKLGNEAKAHEDANKVLQLDPEYFKKQ